MSWDLIGHDWAVDYLRRRLGGGSLRHAYLFCGPESVGKGALVLRLAQGLMCTQAPSAADRCGQCQSCRQVAREQHPDLHVVRAEVEGGAIKVEQIRELQRQIALTPYQAAWRLALVEQADNLTTGAGNALLKTLEEPPDRVILVLTAGSSQSLLPTLVSRCEVLNLRTVPMAVIQAGLRRAGLPPGQAELLAAASLGRPGLALRLAENPERLERRERWLEAAVQLGSMSRADRFAYVKRTLNASDRSENLQRAEEALRVWTGFWRDVMLDAYGTKHQASNPDSAQEIQALADQVGAQASADMVRALSQTTQALALNANVKLAFEALMLDWPKGSAA